MSLFKTAAATAALLAAIAVPAQSENLQTDPKGDVLQPMCGACWPTQPK
ncbi:hypothetical protein PU560_15000 [Georgenia sp. 10Sc9-8]|uniref:Uncharacterized protein n=1 Tax=Georgenia halotolerans TaxID=3028317 RepID=A0ABT5U0P5_9MICO|nr:hypothetical protein [Georgenia halotolerans]